MKKLSEKARARLIRKSRKKRRGLRRNRKPLHQSIADLRRCYPQVTLHYKAGQVEICAPATMRLSKSENSEVLQFLACIRKTVILSPKSLRVDFTTIQDMSPMCAMMLATEIHRWKLVKKCRLRIVDSDQWRPEIKSLMEKMGVFELLSVNTPTILEDQESKENFIRVRSGQQVVMEEAVGNLQEEVERVASLIDSRPELYGGIQEAITNVLHWAYFGTSPNQYHKDLHKRWWFSASYNKTYGRITIMVYDHGVGIPKTLPRNGLMKEHFKKWLSDRGLNTWNDAIVIKAALTIPRSASDLKHRGKGLQEMKRLLSNFNRSSLMVLSKQGECRVDSKGNITEKLHNYPLGGTLIAWEAYVDEVN